jgi:hypothetical protein
MLTSDKLKEIASAYTAWLHNTKAVSSLLMKAWGEGVIDDLWSELRADYPSQYLTYFVRARGMGDIKIGKTNHVTSRVKSIWTNSSRGVDLIACYPADITHETELHREFEHLRLCGEWFRPGQELLTHLAVIGCDVDGFSNVVPAHFYRRNPHLLAANVSSAHKISETEV